MILYWATFIAILGCMWPKSCRLDTSESDEGLGDSRNCIIFLSPSLTQTSQSPHKRLQFPWEEIVLTSGFHKACGISAWLHSLLKHC